MNPNQAIDETAGSSASLRSSPLTFERNFILKNLFQQEGENPIFRNLKLFRFAVLLYFLCFALIAAAQAERMRIILDTDANNELDDQHAIAYMIFNADIFDIEGITTNRSRAGGDIEAHHAEAIRIVQLCSAQAKIKLYKGANSSYSEIIADIEKPDHDGHEAVDFIIERAKADTSSDLVLVAVGTLTNVALAILKDPTIIPYIRVVWLNTNWSGQTFADGARGGYNMESDVSSINPVVDSKVRLEVHVGTDEVIATMNEIKQKMPGMGPHVSPPCNWTPWRGIQQLWGLLGRTVY